ncbi:glycosyltransferase family 9 protein [Azospirillum sp. ST 5-10]|uniref:glycosyltransferase family 9 protein n=1 Tax=unclassified Azospirillum TaxID=2630922 RepID=UPI003F4A72D6
MTTTPNLAQRLADIAASFAAEAAARTAAAGLPVDPDVDRRRRAAARLSRLATAHVGMGRPDDALDLYAAAARLDPTHVGALAGIARAGHQAGRPDIAEAAEDALVAMALEHPTAGVMVPIIAKFGRDVPAALHQLAALTYAAGPPIDGQQLYAGEPLDGATVGVDLACCGYGDALMLARYIPLLARVGAQAVVAAWEPLHPLLRFMPGVADVVSPGVALPGTIMPVSVLALAAGEAATAPYIRTPPDRVRPPFARDRLHVGVVWACGDGHSFPERSAYLADLRGLAGLDEVQWHALQLGSARRQLAVPPPGMAIVDHGDELHDFVDTAAIIDRLDLVVTVDTTAAHLAGAMGRPVWVLLSCYADPRWGTVSTSTPWYPTARLFRQPSPNNWGAAVAEVRDALVGLLGRQQGREHPR